jgi:addiction module HigA family antidote
MIPTDRPPTPPGEMLLEEFLNPMQITQRELAEAIQVPYQRINEIINGKRGVTPSTALRLAKYFNTSADFWMNLQQRCELYEAIQSEESVLTKITPVRQEVEVVDSKGLPFENTRQVNQKRKSFFQIFRDKSNRFSDRVCIAHNTKTEIIIPSIWIASIS